MSIHRCTAPGSPRLFAAETGLPVLLADERLHRRARIHLLWLPEEQHPLTFELVSQAVTHISENHGTELNLIKAVNAKHTDFYTLRLI